MFENDFFSFMLQTNSTLQMAEFDKEAAKNASLYGYDGFANATLKRLFKKIVNIGFAATNDSEQLKAVSKYIYMYKHFLE